MLVVIFLSIGVNNPSAPRSKSHLCANVKVLLEASAQSLRSYCFSERRFEKLVKRRSGESRLEEPSSLLAKVSELAFRDCRNATRSIRMSAAEAERNWFVGRFRNGKRASCTHNC